MKSQYEAEPKSITSVYWSLTSSTRTKLVNSYYAVKTGAYLHWKVKKAPKQLFTAATIYFKVVNTLLHTPLLYTTVVKYDKS